MNEYKHSERYLNKYVPTKLEEIEQIFKSFSENKDNIPHYQ